MTWFWILINSNQQSVPPLPVAPGLQLIGLAHKTVHLCPYFMAICHLPQYLVKPGCNKWLLTMHSASCSTSYYGHPYDLHLPLNSTSMMIFVTSYPTKIPFNSQDMVPLVPLWIWYLAMSPYLKTPLYHCPIIAMPTLCVVPSSPFQLIIISLSCSHKTGGLNGARYYPSQTNNYMPNQPEFKYGSTLHWIPDYTRIIPCPTMYHATALVTQSVPLPFA